MRLETTNNRKILFHTRGFTLVELMVTMAIFITVITIATGALFSAQAVNVRLEQTQVILDEINLATEVMVRDIRYGTAFYCDTVVQTPAPLIRKSCAYPIGGSVLSFRPAMKLAGSMNQINDRVVYYMSDGILYRTEYPSGGSATTQQLTSSNIDINTLTYFVSGANSVSGTNDFNSQSDINQPLTTVILSGTTVPRKSTTPAVPFSIQTSASSREIDI